MGLVLLVVIWLITLVSTYFFVAKTWWLPHGASTAAQFIDGQFALTYILMGIVFVVAQMALGYLVWKYRERASSEPVRYSHGNTTLEILWTTLTAILFIGLNLMGSHVWAGRSSGGGYGHAVCLVLPLSGTRREVRGHESEAD
jgi:cytochrome c oxidase subunit 2